MKPVCLAHAIETAHLLEVPDVAQLFGRCEETIYRWAKAGRLPAIKIGRKWQFNADEIYEKLYAKPIPDLEEWGDSLC